MLPSRVTDRPLAPPPIDKRPFAEALRVIELFRQIEAGRDIKQGPWIEFRLAHGEYDEIERMLKQDDDLWGFVDDKIRYDYNGRNRKLVVRRPANVHKIFVLRVRDAIERQLKAIGNGSGRKAQFAQKVDSTGVSDIHFKTSASSSKSKYSPDASFWHYGAKYPGVIIEVAYPPKKTCLHRLAQSYLLDSNTSIRAVVGLDIEYGKNGSRKATLSIWRTQLFDTADGSVIRTVEEVADEAFRDDEGNPVDYPGLRLRLSDFAFEELAQEEMGDEDTEICISGIQLCQFLTTTESKVRRWESLQRQPLSRHELYMQSLCQEAIEREAAANTSWID